MRVLDLFCCQGGASAGYVNAGFDVVGVDLHPQPRYPWAFHQGDALDALEDYLTEGDGSFAAVHASPPCQAFTKAQRIRDNDHPDLIAPIRALLLEHNVPYVIENVPGSPLIDPIELCGTMFGLRLYRHRLFETSFPVTAPLHGAHVHKQVKMGRAPKPNEFLQPVGNFSGAEAARVEMGMPWASRDGLREAIPAAYTEYIGKQLMTYLTSTTGMEAVA
jgi:DNA (cytosine-5)-methyltransferase 1